MQKDDVSQTTEGKFKCTSLYIWKTNGSERLKKERTILSCDGSNGGRMKDQSLEAFT